MNAHAILVERMAKDFRVRCVSRHTMPVTGTPPSDRWLHVFVPDLHLVSPAIRSQYRYGFDWSAEFSTLTDALLEVRAAMRVENGRLRVTQLGDFVDLWRESGNDVGGLNGILAAFPDLAERFLRAGPDSIGPYLLLGNHDLEVRGHPAFDRARMGHYLEGWDGRLLTTHGDAFDLLETLVPDNLAAAVLRSIFGKSANPQTYPLGTLRQLRDDTTTPATDRDRIQGEAALAPPGDLGAALPSDLNVLRVLDPARRREAHRLLPNLVRSVEKLRAPQNGQPPDAPDLQLVVIGHSHHARIVVDQPAGLVLMDCGAWVESFRAPDAADPQPNRQIGAIHQNDLRIYQLDPKAGARDDGAGPRETAAAPRARSRARPRRGAASPRRPSRRAKRPK